MLQFFGILTRKKQSRQVQDHFKNTSLKVDYAKTISKEKQIKGKNLYTLTDEPILVFFFNKKTLIGVKHKLQRETAFTNYLMVRIEKDTITAITNSYSSKI